VTGDLAFTLAFFALIVLSIAATALAGFLWLLYKELVKGGGGTLSRLSRRCGSTTPPHVGGAGGELG